MYIRAGTHDFTFSLRTYPIALKPAHLQSRYGDHHQKALNYGEDGFYASLSAGLVLADFFSAKLETTQEEWMPIALPMPKGMLIGYCENAAPDDIDIPYILAGKFPNGARAGGGILHQVSSLEWRPSTRLWLQSYTAHSHMPRELSDLYDLFQPIVENPAYEDVMSLVSINYRIGSELSEGLSRTQINATTHHHAVGMEQVVPSQRQSRDTFSHGKVSREDVVTIHTNTVEIMMQLGDVVLTPEWDRFSEYMRGMTTPYARRARLNPNVVDQPRAG
jgi:hypothetical protein